MYVCVFVCVQVRFWEIAPKDHDRKKSCEWAAVCVCVCVRERERKRERETDRQTEWVCVCVCVTEEDSCASERERERERERGSLSLEWVAVCVLTCVRVCVRESGSVCCTSQWLCVWLTHSCDFAYLMAKRGKAASTKEAKKNLQSKKYTCLKLCCKSGWFYVWYIYVYLYI